MKTTLRRVVAMILLLGLVLVFAPASPALAAGAVHTHAALQVSARLALPMVPMETHLSVLLRELHQAIAQVQAHARPASSARPVAHLGMPHVHPVPPPVLHRT